MRVFDDQQRRPPAGGLAKQVYEQFARDERSATRRNVWGLFGFGKVQSKNRIEQRGERHQLWTGLQQVDDALLPSAFTRQPFETTQIGKEWAPHMIRRRALDRVPGSGNGAHALRNCLLDDVGDETALADPGIALENYGAATKGACDGGKTFSKPPPLVDAAHHLRRTARSTLNGPEYLDGA